MLSKKLWTRGVVTTIVVVLSALLGLAAHAAGRNTLIVHPSAEEGAVRPVAYTVWQIADTDSDPHTVAEQLEPLDDAQLAARYPNHVTAPVDDTGNATFADLPDGRYYGRAALADGSSTLMISAPFVVDLPQVAADGTVSTEVTVHPKVVEPTEPPPPPPTGGERFVKVNGSGEKLAGASFVLMAKNDADEYSRVRIGGHPVVVTSGRDGRFDITGLAHGRYYLMETKAPAGYRQLSEPIAFTVDDNSYDDSTIISITNVALPPSEIPKAGDITLLISLITAAILIGMGVYFYRGARESR
ncbi:SpaA isopeptide-forming pilin-related protein [Enemella sp. A6]|uniref:SpaA isopeptide-forming pilin-related protein n=1 Tax=Enemella sp. A6 TaxID=3440152 RepID=UPI003EBFCBC9